MRFYDIILYMDERNSQTDVVASLPLMTMLWLGYLLILLLVDYLLNPRAIFPPWYYLINGFIAVAVLGVALWPKGRAGLGSVFLPLVIGLLSVAPLMMAQLVIMQLPPGPAVSSEAVFLRATPLLFMALVLVAWQYGWRYVIMFSGGIAILTMGLHLYFFRPGGPSLLPPVTVVIIQTISFLVVGYFICRLMKRLKQQQDSLAQANIQLTDYAATLEDLTISRERNRMARELHDTLAHTLSTLSVQLEAAKAYWEVDPTTVQQILNKSLTATRSGLQETRRALKSLRASPLEDLGVLLALHQLATETVQRANLHLNLTLPKRLPFLIPAVEQCIYRVAQEALANAIHHANARMLAVQLSVDDAGVLLLVRDDGVGFDPQQSQTVGRYGLSGMRERAQLVGGQLTVDSGPGKGTTIQLTIKDVIR